MPCVLGYRDIFICPKCDQVIIEKPEINNIDEESVCCDSCNAWWHLSCVYIEIAEEESWICTYCLTDVGFSPKNENTPPSCDEELPTEPINVNMHLPDICTVCQCDAIPVGGEHICSKCRSPVHAWCSNHELITDSSLLLCNNCLC